MVSADNGTYAMRVVFLATPADLAAIFADIEGFTREFLAGH